jgi:hypothetical protein
MRFDSPCASPKSSYRYSCAGFAALQERFDALVAGGGDPEARKAFIRAVYVEKNREIRNQDFQRLNPSTVAEDYLLPRRELFFFILDNWLSSIFLPSLRPETAEALFVFGLGRIFSSYNDTGVQRSTDADINVVMRNDLPAAGRKEIAEKLWLLRRELLEYFKLNLEIDESFTLLREKDVLKRLWTADEETKLRSLLFYKSNSRSIRIIKDEEEIRGSIFAPLESLTDALLFENFLGFANPKITFMKLLSDRAPLPIMADGSPERIEVASVIGSRNFALRWQHVFPKSLRISPPDWYFSMKYFVNRVYDYVCAMQNAGYSLEEIGFDRVSPELGVDPDYRFLRNAHRTMLYFQELEEMAAQSFSADCDYSYVSRSRFLRFTEIHGDKFKSDFADIALKGDLLLHSEKLCFRALKRKIEAKSRDRYVVGKTAVLGLLPADFRYETVFRDKSDFKIRVPYSWADLGYFAFDAIAARMARLVTGRLVPPLAGLGMPSGEHRRYLELAEQMSN